MARALINEPALALADEPTGNLDRESSDLVMELLRSINSETGTGFPISTHDERIAAQCDRRIEIWMGKPESLVMRHDWRLAGWRLSALGQSARKADAAATNYIAPLTLSNCAAICRA
ncbi:MAG: hypothetical protein ACTHJU_00575 [Sphingopyxis sp.]